MILIEWAKENQIKFYGYFAAFLTASILLIRIAKSIQWQKYVYNKMNLAF
jgi:hypothetical protein